MRKLILKMSMTVDGFVGGPNGEIDWVFRTSSPEGRVWTVAAISGAGAHLMGSKSFRDMASYWPTSAEAFAEPMNSVPKVVFTRKGLGDTATTGALKDARAQGTGHVAPSAETLRSWTHPRVMTGDLAAAIATLKAEPGRELLAHGGASLAQSLVALDLVDEYRLAVHPVVLGRGLPLFAAGQPPFDLTLVESQSFPKGVVTHVYRRDR